MPILPSPSNFMLQINIDELHRQTLDWLSTTMLWTRETSFFQKLVIAYEPKLASAEDKRNMEDLQQFISFYSTDVIGNFRQKLRDHESKLASMFKERHEADAGYMEEHKNLMNELSAFSERFQRVKNGLFSLVEKVM